MKSTHVPRGVLVFVLLLLWQLPPVCCEAATPMGTAFTYQGLLTESGVRYTGNAEFQPTLWDAASGGNLIASNSPVTLLVGVTNGLFVLPLDFGDKFPGTGRWVQLEVRTALSGFTILSPRQRLAPAPYSLHAQGAGTAAAASNLLGILPSAQLSGSYGSALTFGNSANSFTGTFGGNGAGLTGLNADNLTSGTVPDSRLGTNVLRTSQVWMLSGNSGTTAGANFLGTTDNQPLELRTRGARALRLESVVRDLGLLGVTGVNVVGGHEANVVEPGVLGATIAGGGRASWSVVSGDVVQSNHVAADAGTIGGGANNGVGAYSFYATISGGQGNDVTTDSPYGFIGGGQENGVASPHASIGGGLHNQVGATCDGSTIGGGTNNSITTYGQYSTIGGGVDNTAGGSGVDYSYWAATVCGGRKNSAGGSHSVVAGGGNNTAGGSYSVVGGGDQNSASGVDSTVGGGEVNTASGWGATVGGGGFNNASAQWATIPGGDSCSASETGTFAAGHRARAIHRGAFVLADYTTERTLYSETTNEFVGRFTGGVRFWTSLGAGVRVWPGGTSWDNLCDRNLKENFEAVDARAVLERVVSMPVQTWNLKSQAPSTRHIGPVAQDFHAAFQLGETNTCINTADADGVALAAIQGLNQKVEQRSKELERRNAALEKEVAELRTLVKALTAQVNGREAMKPDNPRKSTPTKNEP